MKPAELLKTIARGEDSRHQFKRTITNPDALAAELAAFSNSGGGILLIGVDDDGSIAGLQAAEVRRINQLLGNAASQHLRPPVHPLTLTEFKGAFAFLKRNLHHVQRGRGFNTLGELEIPEAVLEELLVNALVHRDYFTSASIRIMVFADRVEIISPGHLPDSLSVADVRRGKTNRRNPTLTEHAFKVLPYRGLGSGIPRALKEWPRIDLNDDEKGNQFTAVVWRPKTEWKGATGQVAGQVAGHVTDPVADPVTDQVTPPVTIPVTIPDTIPVTIPVTAEVERMLSNLNGELTRAQIQEKLGLTNKAHFIQNYLQVAVQSGLIEMTIPNKPNSRLQKYRLTLAGQRLLQQKQGDSRA